MPDTETYEPTVQQQILMQIGRGNLAAISGRRFEFLPDDHTVRLPVSNGYAVEIEYKRGVDLYEVRRMWRDTCKGMVDRVYCEDLSETAYRASCFHDGPFGES